MAREYSSILATLCVGAVQCICPSGIQAQKKHPPVVRVYSRMAQKPIRVNSKLVVVRALVMNKKLLASGPTKAEEKCEQSVLDSFLKLRSSEAFLPETCEEMEFLGLTAKDFHVFVDGAEQPIKRVIPEREALTVRDNKGRHDEYSETPAAVWSTTELSGLMGVIAGNRVYNIAFVPRESLTPGCHKINIKVDRPHSAVYARREYCTSQSPTDILNGTEFGKKMESELASGKQGKIPLSLRAGYVYNATGEGRVQIALQFPWNSLFHVWERNDRLLHAKIGVLGMVYNKDGSVAARFSDFACCTGDTSVFRYGGYVRPINVSVMGNIYLPPQREAWNPHSLHDIVNIPARYDAQIDLPPGQYHLRVVLSDGEKYGRGEVPLNREEYDRKRLAISSVMLCKRFRNAHVAAVEAADANFAPRYFPLVSNGMRVTTAADTRFDKGEPLIAYFEVYEPLLAGNSAQAGQRNGTYGSRHPESLPKVQAHVRILDRKTGKVVKDFAPINAKPDEKAGSRIIPIACRIPFDELPPGAYHLEVQVTDSAGRSTEWRGANFSIK